MPRVGCWFAPGDAEGLDEFFLEGKLPAVSGSPGVPPHRCATGRRGHLSTGPQAREKTARRAALVPRAPARGVAGAGGTAPLQQSEANCAGIHHAAHRVAPSDVLPTQRRGRRHAADGLMRAAITARGSCAGALRDGRPDADRRRRPGADTGDPETAGACPRKNSSGLASPARPAAHSCIDAGGLLPGGHGTRHVRARRAGPRASGAPRSHRTLLPSSPSPSAVPDRTPPRRRFEVGIETVEPRCRGTRWSYRFAADVAPAQHQRAPAGAALDHIGHQNIHQPGIGRRDDLWRPPLGTDERDQALGRWGAMRQRARTRRGTTLAATGPASPRHRRVRQAARPWSGGGAHSSHTSAARPARPSRRCRPRCDR